MFAVTTVATGNLFYVPGVYDHSDDVAEETLVMLGYLEAGGAIIPVKAYEFHRSKRGTNGQSMYLEIGAYVGEVWDVNSPDVKVTAEDAPYFKGYISLRPNRSTDYEEQQTNLRGGVYSEGELVLEGRFELNADGSNRIALRSVPWRHWSRPQQPGMEPL